MHDAASDALVVQRVVRQGRLVGARKLALTLGRHCDSLKLGVGSK